jgi:S-adenosylmethionine:tRNA ribosyltransferase-isomerase
LRPAVWPRDGARLLRLEPDTGRVSGHTLADLPALLRPGDLLVLNDAATLPASLQGSGPRGTLELRLAGPPSASELWPAVAFGAGGWRERTEDRMAPAPLRPGDVVLFAHGLRAVVEAVSSLSARLVDLRFLARGGELWSLLYRAGRPVQYSHLVGPLALWHVQTPLAARPWAVEMPSASRGIGPVLLRALRERSVGVTAVTHAASLSATGDPLLDAALPFPERYELPESAIEAIVSTREQHGRVVAAGTSVVRALEGGARNGEGRLRAGGGVTDLKLGPATERTVVDGLLTGIHEPGTSHFELTRAFASARQLNAAHAHAERNDYLGHEFGDYELLLAA